jgi:hypothetical protein
MFHVDEMVIFLKVLEVFQHNYADMNKCTGMSRRVRSCEESVRLGRTFHED